MILKSTPKEIKHSTFFPNFFLGGEGDGGRLWGGWSLLQVRGILGRLNWNYDPICTSGCHQNPKYPPEVPLYTFSKKGFFPKWTNNELKISYKIFIGHFTVCTQYSGLWTEATMAVTLFCYKPSYFSYVTLHAKKGLMDFTKNCDFFLRLRCVN